MAKVINQGEDYEEDIVDEDYDEEGDEDTESKLNSLFGIPIKFLIIGGAALLLVLIVVIVFATRGSGGDDEVWTPGPNDVIEPLPGEQAGTPAVTDPTATQAPDASTTGEAQSYFWTDSTGALVGISQGKEIGTKIMIDDTTSVGEIAASGTMITEMNTKETAYYISNGMATLTNPGEDSGATEDINTTLRKLGYTGDEITAAQQSGIDLYTLVEEGQALRDKEAKDALVRMSDSASDEFRKLVNSSIYCMPPIEFPETENSVDRIMQDKSYTVNADYEKMELYGNQLFIKLKIANNTYAFMTTTPLRWSQLPDSGNMVVRINYTLYGMKNTFVQFFITGITELDVSQITVNPEDSATDLSTIIGVDSVVVGGTTEDGGEAPVQ